MDPATVAALEAANNSETGEVTPTVEPTAVVAPPVAETNTGHPAWQDILSGIPEMLHETVRPKLQAWDEGVTKKIDSVRSEYADFEKFRTEGIPVEKLEAGVFIANLLETDPRRLYAQLQQMLGEQVIPPVQPTQQASDPSLDLGEFGEVDIANHPKLKEMEANQQKLMEAIAAREAKEAEAQGTAWLTGRQAQISEQLKGQGLEPDWDFILTKAQAMPAAQKGNFDLALDQATKSYVDFVNKFRAPVATTTAPPVLQPTGSTPATQFNPAEMSDADRRKLVAQMLQASLGNN